jgi:trans-aconitate methyltransferase
MTPSDSSAWQSEELSHAFLEGVRGAIPAADLQLALIGRITDQWLSGVSGLLDLGCGDGILGKFLLSRLPAAHGLLLDFSEPMLEAARANLQDQPRAAIARADFGSPAWLEVARPAGPFQLVMSGFAIHHQPDARKRELYAEIFVDHLHAFHARKDPSADRASVARTFCNRADRTENILTPVEEQCRWLRQIGFRDVDCFFKLFELALFGGRRPPAPAG